MTRQARYYHHGRSPAAWVGSILAALGFIVLTVGIFLGPVWVVVWVGTAMVVVAGIATMVMKAMGLGQP